MNINYVYKKNKKIETSLQEIEVHRRVISLLPQLPSVEENIRRKSLLKSSLFSARIEGNNLSLEDVSFTNIDSPNQEKKEVFNILLALKWIYSESPKVLTENVILQLHQMTLKGITPDAGFFRKEVSAIFNQAGIAIYITPPPQHISLLIAMLIKQVNTSKDPGPVTSAIAHFTFEKIHPFLDGNGRVGRLVATSILKNTDYHLRGLISLEEFFENNRDMYYDLLSQKGLDITLFVEFFLEGLVSQGQNLLETLKDTHQEKPQDSLLPRRREILEIIKDHQMVSFDFLARRFIKVSPSTLHYDLHKLSVAGFIKKLGVTNRAVYRLNKKEVTSA